MWDYYGHILLFQPVTVGAGTIQAARVLRSLFGREGQGVAFGLTNGGIAQ